MAADYINVNVKVGDLLPDPAFPHLGPRDGYVIDYQDPDEYNPTYGTKHQETYAVLQLPKNPFLRYLQENNKPIETGRNSNPRIDRDSRYSGVMMPLSSLADEAGSSDLISKWRSKDKVPIVDLRHVNSISRIAKLTSLDVIEAREYKADLNAISSGPYTIGSAAQDYPTKATFVADIIALTDDLTGDIRTNITETAQSNFTADIGAYNFRLYDSDDHGSNILNAKRVTSSYTSHLFRINLPAGSTGEFKIDGYEIYSTAATGDVNIAQIHIQVGLNANIIIDKMFLHSNGTYDATAINPWANGTHRILRSDIWDVPYGIVVYSNGVPDVENCLIYNCSAIGFYGGSKACTLRNVYSFDSGTDDFNTIGSATVNNCASTDDTADDGGSGSGNLINRTAANEAYLDDTQSNFGRPKSSGSIHNSGSTPSYTSNDMAGDAWDVPPPIGPLNVSGVTLYDNGLASTLAFGTDEVTQETILYDNGLASTLAFGTEIVTGPVVPPRYWAIINKMAQMLETVLTTNGYYISIAEVNTEAVSVENIREFPAVNILTDIEEYLNPTKSEAGRIIKTLNVKLDCYFQGNPNDPRQKTIAQFLADIELLFFNDQDTDSPNGVFAYNLEGEALIIIPIKSTPFNCESNKNIYGIEIDVEIHYRQSRRDPTLQY